MPQVQPLRSADPRRLGRYELLGLLGEGGQGIVFLARAPESADDAPGEYCAIKLLHARLTGDATARTRFMSELEAAKKVARFCTAQVLDADVAGDRPYIVSEYVEGRPLRSVVEEDGPRTGGSLERLAISTLTALAAIHRAGVVHRDFTPRNVLLGPEGPRVIDFGIARALDDSVTDDSLSRGTPAYMAPEQVSGAPASPAADMFAWGATMLHAATGSSPFRGNTMPEVISRVLHHTPDLSVLSDPLRSVVEDCLSKDPAHRPTASGAQERLLGETAKTEAPQGVPSLPPAMTGDVSMTDGLDGLHRISPPVPVAALHLPQPGSQRPPVNPPAASRRKRKRVAALSGALAVAGAAVAGGAWGVVALSGPDDTARPQAVSSTGLLPGTGNGNPEDDSDSTKSTGRPKAKKNKTSPGTSPSPVKRKRGSGCRSHSRSFTVTQNGQTAGRISVSATVCPTSVYGTARTRDTLGGNGWAVCAQINAHVKGTSWSNSGTYAGTPFLSSGNGASHPFSTGSGAGRRFDWAYINLGNCRGEVGSVEWDYQSSARIHAA